MTDDYQRRYLGHMERKGEMITEKQSETPVAWESALKVVGERRSIRIFEDREIPRQALEEIFEAARQAPQSCNRQALTLWALPKPNKAPSWLPGATGWAEEAAVIVLVFADLMAYKSPAEISFMPWLDAGVMLATLVYAAHDHGIASCIINPHVRPEDRFGFCDIFNPKGHLFCGAVALGYAAITPECPEKKPMEELVEW